MVLKENKGKNHPCCGSFNKSMTTCSCKQSKITRVILRSVLCPSRKGIYFDKQARRQLVDKNKCRCRVALKSCLVGVKGCKLKATPQFWGPIPILTHTHVLPASTLVFRKSDSKATPELLGLSELLRKSLRQICMPNVRSFWLFRSSGVSVKFQDFLGCNGSLCVKSMKRAFFILGVICI